MTIRFETTASPLQPFDVEAILSRRDRPIDPALEPAFLTGAEGATNLARLLTGEALCVTTGQQPGLLTGPLYTVYKALSAVALARTLEARLERAVVPVFWVAGDDHDFAEANHLYSVGAANEIRCHTLRTRADEAPLTPLYREPVGNEIEQVLAAIAEDTPASEFRPAVFEWIRRHYHPGNDLASAFAGAMVELLDRFGLVVFDPTAPAAKRAMAPLLRQALEQARNLDDALVEHLDDLTRGGHETPVQAASGATLVLLEAELGRDRLLFDESGFTTRRSGERLTLDDLHATVDESPQRFSPNVLLRPVVEAAILPTVAYVAGPGELAYLEECDPIYEGLGVPAQARVPRWSGVAIEPHVDKVLEKFGIDVEDLAAPAGALETRLVRNDIPQAAKDALGQLRETAQVEYDRLADAVSAVDPTLEKPIRQSGRGALRDLGNIEKRIVTHLKKQNDVANRQIAKARAHLFPLGKPQERSLNIVPFLTRYGSEFVDEVYVACTVWSAPLETASSKA